MNGIEEERKKRKKKDLTKSATVKKKINKKCNGKKKKKHIHIIPCPSRGMRNKATDVCSAGVCKVSHMRQITIYIT